MRPPVDRRCRPILNSRSKTPSGSGGSDLIKCERRVRARRAPRRRSIRAETCTTPQPITAVSELISSAQRLWFRGGISREGTPDPVLVEMCCVRVACGPIRLSKWKTETLVGHSTYRPFCSLFLAFFTAFFSFFASFRGVLSFSWTSDAVLQWPSWQRGLFGI